MERRTIRTTLLMLLMTASIGLAISSTVRGQATDSAATSPTIRAACGDTIEICSQRLDKALDAFEKATKALAFATDEIAAHKVLEDLMKQAMAIKDQYLADVLADNKFLRASSTSVKSKARKFFEEVEKVIMFIAGAAITRAVLK